MPSNTLADKVRSKFLTGVLPREEPVKICVRYGRGELCMACDARILSAQILYEAEMADRMKLPMHLGCHGLWVAERIRHGWSPPPLAAN
jgi:hypothetical protein